MKNRTIAYVLLSGGLDSMLAVRLLQKQDVDICAVCFESNFYSAKSAKKSAEILGVELKVVNIADPMIELIKNPPHGFGKNMNPCIDCHGLMIRKVKELFIDNSDQTAFIATGEVLGQRPFSQNSKSLEKVRGIAGCDILRPLSAKLLPITEIEESGVIDREKLEDIQGRTRKRQMELAEKYNIKTYPSPSGGCILTDPEYGKKLKELSQKWPEFISNDAEIIKHGRVFWLEDVLVVVGRNKEECEQLIILAKEKDCIIELKNKLGPTTLARGLDYGAIAKHQIVLNSQISVNLPKKNLTNITTLPKSFLNKFTQNLKIYAKSDIRQQPRYKNTTKNFNNIKIPKTREEIKKNIENVASEDIFTPILQLTGYYKKELRDETADFEVVCK